jgi:hypothetical protein
MMGIEKSIPCPPAYTCKGKYRFDLMEVGDSILIADADVRRARVTVDNYSVKYPQIKFKSWRTDEGVRIWRVA